MKSSPLPPLLPDTVVVQSRGMARWLSLALADDLGICANLSCPFPNAFVNEMFSLILPDISSTRDDREVMAWRIMGLLPSLRDKPGFQIIRNYLSDGDQLKRFQLAWRLADRYDQYMIYRPEVIGAWERGRDEGWQAELWRKLVALSDDDHRVKMHHACLKRLGDHGFDSALLPSRIGIFGISSLPPYHVQLFAALARHIEVHFFLLSPCAEYWGEIVSGKEMIRLERRFQQTAEELYLEEGNSILAAMGQLGRDFLGLLHQEELVEFEDFIAPGEETLLHILQSDILYLRETSNSGLGQRISKGQDDSIRFQSCHSPLRELEVLRDYLLDLLDGNPDITPRDILVMTPDIDTYGPLVQAVFNDFGEMPAKIPFTIADRSFRGEGLLTESLFMLLDLIESRFGILNVLNMIEIPSVQRKFKLEQADSVLLKEWFSAVRIKWGINSRDRGLHGVPETSGNTWQSGLDRLLLGYAMADQGTFFSGILPSDCAAGAESYLLGTFLDFFAVISRGAEYVRVPHRLANWADFLEQIFDDCFEADGDTEWEQRVIRRGIRGLAEQGNEAGLQEELEFSVVRTALARIFEEEQTGSGFLAGGVTFCAMLPMRAIPFQVICMLGMNDGVFPRRSRSLSFDILTKNYQPGDRSARLDDRYLFLESLLSARRKLYVSYMGQSPKDGKPLHPSTLVRELLDTLGAMTELGTAIDDILITPQRLQSYDPIYFKQQSGYFSYSRDDYYAAQALLGPRRNPAPLVKHCLDPAANEPPVIAIQDLLDFFLHPARYFCRHRLGIELPGRQEELNELEPVHLQGLDLYRIETELVDRILQGHENGFQQRLAATGDLPHGVIGEVLYSEMLLAARGFTEQLGEYVQDVLPPLAIDMRCGEHWLQGTLDNNFAKARIRYRNTRLKAKDQIRMWIEHLILNVATPAEYPHESIVIGKDYRCNFRPVPEAREFLATILDWYHRGQSCPLPFFPESSKIFVRQVIRGKEGRESWGRAKDNWEGSGFRRGESQDPYFQLCFQGRNPLDDLFAQVALDFYQPLLTFREKVKR
ncbi:exodeoxyribonuclease V subunit gamma [Thermodesulfobacteriota bacterium]